MIAFQQWAKGAVLDRVPAADPPQRIQSLAPRRAYGFPRYLDLRRPVILTNSQREAGGLR